jgi:hypothetical protein
MIASMENEICGGAFDLFRLPEMNKFGVAADKNHCYA